MATGSADIAACAKVSDFRTLPLPLRLPPFISPCLSLSVSGLSIRIHLSDGSFWGAYSWHAGVFISTSNPFRVGLGDQSCHWQAARASAPQQPSILSSSWLYVITKEEPREAPVQSKNLGWLHFSGIARQVLYLHVPRFDALAQLRYSNLTEISCGTVKPEDLFVICLAFLPSYIWFVDAIVFYLKEFVRHTNFLHSSLCFVQSFSSHTATSPSEGEQDQHPPW